MTKENTDESDWLCGSDPDEIHAGIAMNMSASAEALVDDAEAYIAQPTSGNARDLLASMRIMRHRLDKAFREIGVEP
jgi:hypothetical protein